MATPGGEFVDFDGVPQALKCPITLELFEDPVRTCDGLVYEREAIERWFQDHTTAPKTQNVLGNKTLTPDRTTRDLADAFRAGLFQIARGPASGESPVHGGSQWGGALRPLSPDRLTRPHRPVRAASDSATASASASPSSAQSAPVALRRPGTCLDLSASPWRPRWRHARPGSEHTGSADRSMDSESYDYSSGNSSEDETNLLHAVRLSLRESVPGPLPGAGPTTPTAVPSGSSGRDRHWAVRLGERRVARAQRARIERDAESQAQNVYDYPVAPEPPCEFAVPLVRQSEEGRRPPLSYPPYCRWGGLRGIPPVQRAAVREVTVQIPQQGPLTRPRDIEYTWAPVTGRAARPETAPVAVPPRPLPNFHPCLAYPVPSAYQPLPLPFTRQSGWCAWGTVFRTLFWFMYSWLGGVVLSVLIGGLACQYEHSSKRFKQFYHHAKCPGFVPGATTGAVGGAIVYAVAELITAIVSADYTWTDKYSALMGFRSLTACLLYLPVNIACLVVGNVLGALILPGQGVLPGFIAAAVALFGITGALISMVLHVLLVTLILESRVLDF